jgi:DNA repair protein RecO (recombination protein O)
MLHKTRGIVLSFIKYRETSIICRIYTELFGLQSYIVNSVRTQPSKNSRSKIALFQPLTLLDLVVYYRKDASLNRISEIKCSHPFTSLVTDYKKITMALFLSEVLGKTIQEESPNEALFEFLHKSVYTLDTMDKGYENFHIKFLLELSKHLGFFPSSVADVYSQVLEEKDWQHIIDKEETAALEMLLAADYNDQVHVSNQVRRELLAHLIKFYSLHVDNFKELKSVQVLKEILS